MLIIVISCTAMAAVSLYLVLNPFFKPGGVTGPQAKESFDLESVYEAVNELEMDVLMNKITPEEFNSLKETYYRIASEAIEQKDSADEDIVQALKEIRQQKSQPAK